MAYCLTHKLFYTQNCPRCQRRKSANGVENSPVYLSSALPTRDRAIQMLEQSVANINKKMGSHHAVRVENDELVVVFNRNRREVTFAHAPFSQNLWGGVLNTLEHNLRPDSHEEIQAVINTMQIWGGRVYTFRL